MTRLPLQFLRHKFQQKVLTTLAREGSINTWVPVMEALNLNFIKQNAFPDHNGPIDWLESGRTDKRTVSIFPRPPTPLSDEPKI